MTGAAVAVERLEKALGANNVLRGISFEAQSGEIFGLLGPNGAGKTTTLRIICTLLSPDAGTVDVLGFGTRSAPEEVRRRIGVVTADIGVYPRLSARENIEYFARLCRLVGGELNRKVDGVIERLDMGSFAKQRAESLSSGQKQKVAIARAIVHDPEVLVLDEPTAGLDPAQTRETRELITAVGREHTVILSSHILPEVAATCERVLIINQGRIVADDTPEKLAERIAGVTGHEVEMLIQGDGPMIEERLRAVNGVEGVTVNRAGEGLWSVVVTTFKADMRDELARAAVEGGFGLHELQARTLSLEDVFLHLTTEEPDGEES